jgi:hypothetical protein
MRWLLLCCCLGCSTSPGAAPMPADAAAQVAGQTISLAEVEALARSTGLAPRAALEALVRERLLVDHARAYARHASVQHGVEQALVRKLLADEVGDAEPEVQRAALARLLARLTAEAHVAYREDAIQRTFAPAP